MRATLIAAAALAALTLPAQANTPAEAPATETEKAKPKKICRTLEASVGRIGTGKKCLTEEQWAKEDAKRNGRAVRSIESD